MNRMKDLVEKLNKFAYEYYVLDKPTIADKEFDLLYDELVSLEKREGLILDNSPTKRVGGQILKGFKENKHKTKLYSLDKATTLLDLQNFDEKVKKMSLNTHYTLEYKFDGLTISLLYENGKFIRSTTRGNGEIGEDVTENIRTIKSFPLEIDYLKTVEIQGEAVIRLSNLEKYNKTALEPLKNARNAVAGAVRNLDTSVCNQRMVEILFYNANFENENYCKTQEEMFLFLKRNKFKVSEYFEKEKDINKIFNLIEKADESRKVLDILTDGMVIKVNEVSVREELGYTSKFPKWAIAYKFEASVISTILNEIVWQVGRTGKLTPLGILDEVDIGGVTVKKATLNNIGDIERKKVKLPCRVLIRRSHDVIPEILEATEYFENSKDILAPVNCPYCGEKLVEDGANIFCRNENCEPKIIATIAHFATRDAMNIEGFSEMTAKILLENFKVTKPYMLYELNANDLKKLDGFKDKRSDNLIEALIKSKNVELSAFVFALGINGVGKKSARDLSAKFNNFEDLKNASIEELLQVNEIGEIIANNIFNYFKDYENLNNIEKLFELGVKPYFENLTTGTIFNNQKVVVTGTLVNFKRSDVEKMIVKEGGIVSSAVSAQTTLLIAGENAGSKLDKAKKLGLKIIDESELVKMLAK